MLAVSVADALRLVGNAAGAPRRRIEKVPLGEALGRVLAEDVRLDRDAPPFDRATMDGYAVRSADAVAPGTTLRVIGRIGAGSVLGKVVGPGEAAAIMTGAPMPEGADAVVPFEVTDAVGGARGTETAVRLLEASGPRSNVSRRGEQAAAGDVVLRAGTPIHPGTVGVLAAAGVARVPVAARPRVAILSTGDEIVPVEATPGPAQIRESNGAALRAQIQRAGGLPVSSPVVPDEPGALARAIAAGLDADVLLLSGGVSLGERDLVPAALLAAGVERHFHRWAVKPGGPLWFGSRGDTLVFGLPGNPVATFVGFEVLVVPALRTRLGAPFEARRTVLARPDGRLPAPIARLQFVLATLRVDPEGHARVRPVRFTGSGDLFSLAGTDALALIGSAAGDVAGAASSGVAPAPGAPLLVPTLPLDGSLGCGFGADGPGERS